jgi:hypothetical protein
MCHTTGRMSRPNFGKIVRWCNGRKGRRTQICRRSLNQPCQIRNHSLVSWRGAEQRGGATPGRPRCQGQTKNALAGRPRQVTFGAHDFAGAALQAHWPAPKRATFRPRVLSAKRDGLRNAAPALASSVMETRPPPFSKGLWLTPDAHQAMRLAASRTLARPGRFPR